MLKYTPRTQFVRRLEVAGILNANYEVESVYKALKFRYPEDEEDDREVHPIDRGKFLSSYTRVVIPDNAHLAP